MKPNELGRAHYAMPFAIERPDMPNSPRQTVAIMTQRLAAVQALSAFLYLPPKIASVSGEDD